MKTDDLAAQLAAQKCDWPNCVSDRILTVAWKTDGGEDRFLVGGCGIDVVPGVSAEEAERIATDMVLDEVRRISARDGGLLEGSFRTHVHTRPTPAR